MCCLDEFFVSSLYRQFNTTVEQWFVDVFFICKERPLAAPYFIKQRHVFMPQLIREKTFLQD